MPESERIWNPGWDAVHADPRLPTPSEEVVFEPMLWGLFSLGGFITAFLLPVTIFVISFAAILGLLPANRFSYDAFADRFADLIVRIFFLVLIGGALFHGMHRLKYLLVDAGLKAAEPFLNVLLYGVAALGTLAAVYYTILIDLWPIF